MITVEQSRLDLNRHFRVKCDGQLVGWLGLVERVSELRAIWLVRNAMRSTKQVFEWNNRVKMYAK